MHPAVCEFAYWMRRYRHIWLNSIVISVLNPLFFLVGIGFGLGRIVDQAGGQPIAGASYLAFFAPGLLAASAMQLAFLEGTGSVYEALRVTNTYRATAATPMRPVDILLGHMLFVVFRVFTMSGVFVAVMAALGVTRSASVLWLPPAAVLTGIAFATPAAALAASVARPDQLGAIFRFVVLPMYLFSGTFFSVAQLPGVLAVLARLTPLWQGVELCRELSLGTVTTGSAFLHIGYLAVLTGVGAVVAARRYRLQLQR